MENFNELFSDLNIRMHKKQKKAFRNYVTQKAQDMNYSVKTENGLFAKNIIVGDINKAEYVFTAHYDTPPKLPKFFVKHMLLYSVLFATIIMVAMFGLPILVFQQTNSVELLEILSTLSYIGAGATFGYSLMHIMGLAGNANKTNYNDNTSGCYTLLKLMQEYQTLPQKEKDKIAFVFFDNEEKFLLGSFTHKTKNKKIYKNKTYINFDCVALGKQMNLYYFGKKTDIVNQLENQIIENKNFIAHPQKSNLNSMSDHFALRKANHVCMLTVDPNNNKSIYSQIHCSNDTKIDYSNVDNIISTINSLPFIQSLQTTKYSNLKILKTNSKTNSSENIINYSQDFSNSSQDFSK